MAMKQGKGSGRGSSGKTPKGFKPGGKSFPFAKGSSSKVGKSKK